MKKHILMIPFTAFGHLIPFLELAKRLSQHYRVTLAVSQYLADDIKSRDLLSEEDLGIAVHCIDDGFTGERGAEKTGIKNFKPLAIKFIVALERFLASIYSEQLQRLLLPELGEISVVIADLNLAGQVALCYQRAVPVFLFSTSLAESMLLKGLMFEVDSPVCTNPENEFPMWLSAEHTRDVLPKDVNGIMIRVKKYAPLACGIIVNSTRELEIPVIKALSDIDSMRSKSIFMVGPLIPTAGLSSSKKQQARLVTEWLSSKERNSVLYISFGTIISPSPQQLSEMASAFLAMNRPFIWSLSDTLRHELPDEIQSRMSDSPTDFLVLGWVPQRTILAHSATAAFLSHCGWNSTIEALFCGVPIIGWPLCADQGMNVELVLKHGAGIRVQGTGWKAERTVSAQEIIQLINHVISEELYRTKALEASRLLSKAVGPGGSSAVDFADLIQQLSQQS